MRLVFHSLHVPSIFQVKHLLHADQKGLLFKKLFIQNLCNFIHFDG